MKSRGWVFTLNNYTFNEAEVIKAAECRCMKAGYEVGKCGTPHIQGAVYFDNPLTLKGVKRRLGDRVHLKKMRGTWEQQDYCLKDGDICRNDGEPPAQGARTDIAEFREAIAEGIDEVESYERFPGLMARYPRFRGGYLTALTKKKGSGYRKIDARIFWGPGGTGKTKAAMCDTEGNYKPSMYRLANTANLKWFDGYAGEDILIIDEFGGSTCTFDRFKQLLDGHPMQVETKGGMVWACWTKIFITSNEDPNLWWQKYDLSLPEFSRRITHVVEFKAAPLAPLASPSVQM